MSLRICDYVTQQSRFIDGLIFISLLFIMRLDCKLIISWILLLACCIVSLLYKTICCAEHSQMTCKWMNSLRIDREISQSHLRHQRTSRLPGHRVTPRRLTAKMCTRIPKMRESQANEWHRLNDCYRRQDTGWKKKLTLEGRIELLLGSGQSLPRTGECALIVFPPVLGVSLAGSSQGNRWRVQQTHWKC